MMKHLFNFKKSPMTRAVYNSEYARFVSRQSLGQVYSALYARKHGLGEHDVENRRRKFGENIVVHEERTNPMKLFVSAFINPFIGVLTALILISFVLDVVLAEPGEQDWTTIIIISTMVVFSAILRFVQELKAGRSSDALLKMVKNTCYVERANNESGEIPVEELVPGDIVLLSAGDMIPADLRIVETKDFFVSQSSLTGESDSIEKAPTAPSNSPKGEGFNPDGVLPPWGDKRGAAGAGSVIDLNNLAFMGSNVVSGTARGIVFATGNQTYLGSIAKSIAGHRAETAFDKGITKVSMLLIRFMLIMVPFVFMVNGFTKGDWLEAFIFAVSVAVGLTPEMLPMIVTANLAKGAVRMSKKKVIVKDLNAIQNFGAMNILCTDKTGTLTRDKVVLVKYINADGSEDKSRRILRHAFFNSYYGTGLKNLMDKAIVEHVAPLQLPRGGEKEVTLDVSVDDYKKIDEIPFDFNRRRMSVVLEDKQGKRQIITKGAVEEMLQICSHCELDGKVIPMTANMHTMAMNIVHDMNSDGMRVLAVAHKSFIEKDAQFSVEDEREMVLIGYLAFLDPPKESATAAITKLQQSGVDVKVLSGDNDAVVSTIAAKVGLYTTVDGQKAKLPCITGPEFEKMSDPDKMLAVLENKVFAKLTPHQKTEIIQLLQEQDNTVGFLGDGINDAAALRQSDIGISVDSAVDIAKESADIILLEKDLMVLEQGVLSGRETFGNIIKYVKMTASSNFGNMFSVLAASAFLPFLPMLSIHLLIQNLLYDISQTAIPFDRMDKEFLMKPRRWDSSDLSRFMIFIGPISSIFDITTYLLMWFVFGCQSSEMQTLFQSGWFIEGLLSQTLIVHMIRTRRIPFIQSNAAWPLMLMTFAIMAIGIAIPFTSFGSYIGLMPLPLSYFPWLIATLLCYCVLTQLIKMWYIRRFGKWL